MSGFDAQRFEDVARAFHEVAQFLGCDVSEVSRRRWRRAVEGGARFSVGVTTASVLGRSVGGWAALRKRVVESGLEFDAVRVAPLSPLPPGQGIHGVSTLTDGDGNVKLQWIKTRAEDERRAEMYRALFDELAKGIAPVPKTRSPEIPTDDLLAVVPLGDPHVGLLTWAAETGASFDLEANERIMCAAVDHLVTQGPAAKKCLIINLGDYFHADDESQRTRRSGHKLDVDGRWAKVLGVGLRIISRIIDRALEVHETVEFRGLPGNHDDHSALFLQIALNERYRLEPRVEIAVSPRVFQYVEFGRCLIGMTHGHTSKHADLGAIMAADKPEAWGRTAHRYFYCGHLHHTRKIELRGCMVEVFRTMAAPDAYAVGHGYRSGRDMQRIALHREWGEVSRATVTAAALQAQMVA